MCLFHDLPDSLLLLPAMVSVGLNLCACNLIVFIAFAGDDKTHSAHTHTHTPGYAQSRMQVNSTSPTKK